MKIISKALGITAWQARVSIAKDSQPYFRMFFHLDGFAADTNFAKHVAGAVLLTAELFYGPLIMRGEEELAFELPRHGHLSRRKIYSARQLAAAAIAHGMTPVWPSFLAQEISSCSFIADEVFGAAWAVASYPLEQPWLYDAMAFYSASIRAFFPSPFQLEEAIGFGVPLAANRSVLAEAEAAFQNAYKAIEAVVGDPPKNDKRFAERLSGAGLSANELVGFEDKTTLLESIRGFETIRNKRAAHGGSPKRGLTLLEVFECQACAKHVIEGAIDHLAGPGSIEKWDQWHYEDSPIRQSTF